ncbi:MAG: DedA family protein [Solirubrobacteraceae bacterium]
MFNSVANAVSGSPWTYVLLAAVCAGDAVFPVLPSETMVIAAAVLAAQGHLNIVLVVIAAAVGAFAGDNTAYGVGHSGLRRLADRLMNSEKNRRRLEWARGQLQHRGGWIIIVARFIPGGRTATTYVAGTVGMPWKSRFLPADGAAAVLWGLYSSALGYFGGAAFENNFWLPMLIASAAGILLGAVAELLRRNVLDRRDDRGRRARPTTES